MCKQKKSQLNKSRNYSDNGRSLNELWSKEMIFKDETIGRSQ